MLSNAQAWTSKLAGLYANERQALVDFLLALVAFDSQRLWEELGHANLFSYLTRELGMSKSTAFYRKTACDLVRRFPSIIEPIRDGKLCLSVLSELGGVVDEANFEEVLPRFFGCSRREAEKVAVSISPVEAPPMRDVVRRLGPASVGTSTSAPNERWHGRGSPVIASGKPDAKGREDSRM